MTKKERLRGVSPTEIAREAGISRASVYNWLNGEGTYVKFLIEPAIEKIKTRKNEESDSDGLRQKLELEGSIQDSN